MGFTTAGQNLHPPAGDKVAATMFTAAGDSDRKTVWVSLPWDKYTILYIKSVCKKHCITHTASYSYQMRIFSCSLHHHHQFNRAVARSPVLKSCSSAGGGRVFTLPGRWVDLETEAEINIMGAYQMHGPKLYTWCPPSIPPDDFLWRAKQKSFSSFPARLQFISTSDHWGVMARACRSFVCVCGVRKCTGDSGELTRWPGLHQQETMTEFLGENVTVLDLTVKAD